MSQNTQGFTFGFFENLPTQDKTVIDDILFGSKAAKAKPELPWEDGSENVTGVFNAIQVDELSPMLEQDAHFSSTIPNTYTYSQNVNTTCHMSVAGTTHDVIVSNPPGIYRFPDVQYISSAMHNVLPGMQSVSHIVHPELAHPVPHYGGSEMHPMPQAAMGQQLPPGLHQQMYNIPVVSGMPPHMVPMVGIYHQPGMPINYMHVMSSQNIPMVSPHHDSMSHMKAHSPTDDDIDNNNSEKNKEMSRILGGKTYERRNKKRRPPNYYESLERRHDSSSQDMYGNNIGQTGARMHAYPQMPVNTVYQDARATYMNHMVISSGMAPHYPHSVSYGGNTVMKPAYHFGDSTILATFSNNESHNSDQGMNDTLPQQYTMQQPGQNFPMETSSHFPHVQTISEVENSSEIYTDRGRASESPFRFGDVQEALDSIERARNMVCHESQLDKSVHALDVKSDLNVKLDGDLDVTSVIKTSESVSVRDVIADLVQENNDLVQESNDRVQESNDCDETIAYEEVGSDSNFAETVHVVEETKTIYEEPAVVEKTATIQEEPAIVEYPAVDLLVVNDDAPKLDEFAAMENLNNNAFPESEMPKAKDTMSNNPSTAPVSNNPPTALSKPASWAALFRGTNTAAAAAVIFNPSAISEKNKPDKDALPVTVAPEKDDAVQYLGSLLKDYTLSYSEAALQPRGLINRGNWCYVNATLQALGACPPLYNLIKRLSPQKSKLRGPTSTPILDCMVEFVNEFAPMPPLKPLEKNNKGKGNMKQDLPVGPIFEPTYVYKMLQVMKYDGFKSGRQEDAEEFLSCLLNGLHDEMVASMKMDKTEDENAVEVTTNGNGEVSQEHLSLDGETEESGWEQVGPKNKSVLTRSATSDVSPISSIFRGCIRNTLVCPGKRDSATLQPFFTLQLEIQSEKVRTVQEALDSLVSKEMLQDFTCSKTKLEVDASRRSMLEELPPVLILHLKCFVYDKNGGCQKVVKQLDFSGVLDIHKDLLSPSGRNLNPPNQRRYKLFAVVKHVGVRAAGGHYVADVYHKHLSSWVHYDDNNVYTVTMPQVFMFRPPKVPYLLYYRRADLSS